MMIKDNAIADAYQHESEEIQDRSSTKSNVWIIFEHWTDCSSEESSIP